MKFRINADLFRIVAGAVSTEETRYYLCGVNVEPHPVKGAILTATDGHRLLSAYDADGFTDGVYIVPAGKDLVRATKIGGPERRRTGGGLVMVADGGSVTFRNAYDQPTVTLPVKPIDGTFPDWRRVIPSAPATVAIASYNPSYVAGLADVCGELDSAGFEGVAFTMAAADAGSPALVNYGAAPIFGVIMPMRNCTPLAVPAWVRARPADAFAAADLGPVVQDQAPSDAPSCPSDAPSDPVDDAPQAVVQDEAVAMDPVDHAAALAGGPFPTAEGDGCPLVRFVTLRQSLPERAGMIRSAADSFEAMPGPAADPADHVAEPIKDTAAAASEACPADEAEYCPIVVLVTGRFSTLTMREYRIDDAVRAFESMPEPAADLEPVKPSGLATMRAAALASTAMVPPGVVVPFHVRRAA